jgi:hypothetical protein
MLQNLTQMRKSLGPKLKSMENPIKKQLILRNTWSRPLKNVPHPKEVPFAERRKLEKCMTHLVGRPKNRSTQLMEASEVI